MNFDEPEFVDVMFEGEVVAVRPKTVSDMMIDISEQIEKHIFDCITA